MFSQTENDRSTSTDVKVRHLVRPANSKSWTYEDFQLILNPDYFAIFLQISLVVALRLASSTAEPWSESTSHTLSYWINSHHKKEH